MKAYSGEKTTTTANKQTNKQTKTLTSVRWPQMYDFSVSLDGCTFGGVYVHFLYSHARWS